ESHLERYVFLMALQDRNETLFYRLVQGHIRDAHHLYTDSGRRLPAIQPRVSQASRLRSAKTFPGVSELVIYPHGTQSSKKSREVLLETSMTRTRKFALLSVES